MICLDFLDNSGFRAVILTKGVWQTPGLQTFLPFEVDYHPLHGSSSNVPDGVGAVVGWGRKASAIRAQKYATQHQLKFISLEDGFIRSVGLGSKGCPPVSMIIDDIGIYFDAYRESRLELLINQKVRSKPESDFLMKKIVEQRVSKYNTALKDFLNDSNSPEMNVLIIDQTCGDQSIGYSGASESDFERMLWRAYQDYPQAKIWIKTHPEVSVGAKKGYLSHIKGSERVKKITDDVNPFSLLEKMDVVYVVSSHMGFEALMLQKKVYCFGMPWYAGWGLTDDTYAPKNVVGIRRKEKKSIACLFEAAYLDYTSYINPTTNQKCGLDEALIWIVENRRWAHNFSGSVLFFGFSRWKELYLKKHMKFPFSDIYFSHGKKKKVDHVVYWGALNKNTYKSKTLSKNVWVMEDGFIRSIGLGAKLIRPLSLVVDSIGIYYDSTQPSGLEQWYNTAQISDTQRQRAQGVRERLVSEGLSKYNVGEQEDWPDVPQHRRCILIPGQVEDDASVLLGGVDIRTNLQLIQAVRQRYPDAFVVYKPHPDVTAGLRVGAVDPVQLSQYVDAVVQRLGMPACLSRVDEVHTITSLTGFEALLRGVPVYCYGLPFYAGWGLTTDRHICSRRQNRLSLDELVYGALIAYPLYLLPNGEGFVQVEQAIDELIKQRHNQQTLPQKALGYTARLRATALRWSKKLWP